MALEGHALRQSANVAGLLNDFDWAWSSTRAHLAGRDDGLVTVAPVLERTQNFAELIAGNCEQDGRTAALRTADTTGRAVGTPQFVADLERRLGRPIARRAPGRKPAAKAEDQPALL